MELSAVRRAGPERAPGHPPTARCSRSSPRTTCSPCRCSTTPGACSARSASTTWSTGCSAPVGGSGRAGGVATATGGVDMKRRSDLTHRAQRTVDVSYDPEFFGQFSESIARFIGTARFLVWQTIVIIVWLAVNTLPPEKYQFDPWNRGLVLLTLVLSLQAVVRGAADPARPEPPGAPRPRRRPSRTARSPSARRPTPSSSPARSPACALAGRRRHRRGVARRARAHHGGDGPHRRAPQRHGLAPESPETAGR